MADDGGDDFWNESSVTSMGAGLFDDEHEGKSAAQHWRDQNKGKVMTNEEDTVSLTALDGQLGLNALYPVFIWLIA